MRINGTETTSRKVELNVSPRDVYVSLRAEVFSKLKLPTYDMPFVENGKIVVEEEEHGHTTYWTKKVLTETPSQDQLDAIETFRNLAQLMQKLEIKL